MCLVGNKSGRKEKGGGISGRILTFMDCLVGEKKKGSEYIEGVPNLFFKTS